MKLENILTKDFGCLLKKIRYRKNLLMVPDGLIAQSGVLSLILRPPDQLFLPFYPPVDKYKVEKKNVEKNDFRCLNWPINLGY